MVVGERPHPTRCAISARHILAGRRNDEPSNLRMGIGLRGGVTAHAYQFSVGQLIAEAMDMPWAVLEGAQFSIEPPSTKEKPEGKAAREAARS